MKWEYCEVWWEPNRILVNAYSARGNTEETHAPEEWPNVLAQLGADGWEMVGVLASPASAQQYWYYFKRSLD